MSTLISVSDKINIEDIAGFLLSNDKQIISTGGTYTYIINSICLEKNKMLVTKVEDITQFPEILGGRVKTLHPMISGALLARKNNLDDLKDMNTHGIPSINMVIVNLYPFCNTVEKHKTNSCDSQEVIENIDIGGQTLIRESVKNYQDILIVVDPNDYKEVIDNYSNIDLEFKWRYAKKALSHATQYDIHIFNWFSNPNNHPFSLEMDKQTSEPENVFGAQDIFRHYTKEYDFKYGCNPHQNKSALYTINSIKNPFQFLNGSVGYINMIDVFHSWQLVNELATSLDTYAAASFKHTSPAGVGINRPLNDTLKHIYNVENVKLTPLATAFIRARYTDPMSSFGDFIALSHKVDVETAQLIKKEVSDGVIAPYFDANALRILKEKKNGRFIIIKVDETYCNQNQEEIKELFGMAITQEPNNYKTSIEKSLNNIVTSDKQLTLEAKQDLIIANISLKYAQSNNVAYAYDGQLLGIASGQQNRVDCVRLAGNKARLWFLMQHPKTLELRKCFKDGLKRQDKTNACIRFIHNNFTSIERKHWLDNFDGDIVLPSAITDEEANNFIENNFNKKISLASDAFFPFRDNIDVSSQFGVKYVLQPGGSTADENVINACDEYGMVMAFSGARMFYH